MRNAIDVVGRLVVMGIVAAMVATGCAWVEKARFPRGNQRDDERRRAGLTGQRSPEAFGSQHVLEGTKG